MTEITIDQMSNVDGCVNWTRVANITCGVIGIGSGVYGVGLLANWWNPIGWVSAAGIAADLVCGAYALS